MHSFIFRRLARLRENYWFLPSTMTLAAVLLGIFLPYLDSQIGSGWVEDVGFLRATDADGARAILTTLAGATLGVAGVAFSVTIVAVSFASSNYGPRLIGNFMGDRKNQTVLGVFVATFVYCITVLSTVHTSTEHDATTIEAFVPQLSVFGALLMTLAAVGALIAYIHHIPESINIMNLTAEIGGRLQRAIIKMLEEDDPSDDTDKASVDIEAWCTASDSEREEVIHASRAGFLQQVDMQSLAKIAREENIQIRLYRAPGDFLVEGETVMAAFPAAHPEGTIRKRLEGCFTLGANRTVSQDVLFLSDQLVEVLGRALSTGVNDPQTAFLCLNWLRAGLVTFARREPLKPVDPGARVLFQRLTLEAMLSRSFDDMRQYIAGDRTTTLHAMTVLTDIALAATRQSMVDACLRQIRNLAQSANELLEESAAREEVKAGLRNALGMIASDRAEARCSQVYSLPRP